LADALIDSDVLIDVLRISGNTAAWLAEYARGAYALHIGSQRR
jgi:hypothetical protein